MKRRIPTRGTGGSADPRRIAMLSVHTSPLDQPGIGDAGGLNVYVVELAKRLARANIEVDVFTRTSARAGAAAEELVPGVTVRHLSGGRSGTVDKNDLPAELCALTTAFLRTEEELPKRYDAIHSHYWLSGHVGSVASDRWNVPLVHSMHTMAKVKNRALADGDPPESSMRVIGEQRVVDASDRIIANTSSEKLDLQTLYGAEASQTVVVNPGVDLDAFSPGSKQAARRKFGLSDRSIVLLFVGRIQPLKAPDLLIRAAAEMVNRDPSLRENLVCVVCGGPSGTGIERQGELAKLAAALGVTDIVRFEPPANRADLADWYRSADVVCVPSYSESFGLVAVEAQACGTPVLAARVGGLPTAVAHGQSGLLVESHAEAEWAEALQRLTTQDGLRQQLADGARAHASQFSWDVTADRTREVYRAAVTARELRSSIGPLQQLPA